MEETKTVDKSVNSQKDFTFRIVDVLGIESGVEV